MNTTKLTQFLKLGLATAAISLSMGAMAHGNEDKAVQEVQLSSESSAVITEANHMDIAKSISQDNVATTHKEFSSDKFLKKYHINGKNIKITPLYLKEGLPFNWKNSQIMPDQQNAEKFNIVVVLDKNGDLYNVDKDFQGKNKLSPGEKDLLLEQTVLHEYAHTHFFHGNKVNSSKLTAEENTTFNNTFLSKYQTLSTNSVYMEAAAEISSTVLLINDNQSNLPTVKNLLVKINNVEVAERSVITAEGRFDSHLMMAKGQSQVLKDFNQFKNMNLTDVLDYTKSVTSDLVVQYTTKFNEDYKILKALESRYYNQVALINIVHDLSQGKNMSNETVNPTLYAEATELVKKYPEFKKDIQYLSEDNSLPLNLKTLYLAANVNSDRTFINQISYGDMDDARSDKIFDDISNSVGKLMKNDTTTQAAKLISKLENQYKASPSAFEVLPEYKINHSLSHATIPTLNKFSVMDNIKKMKEQSLGKTHSATLKM